MSQPPVRDDILDRLQRTTLDYFLKEYHPETGLIADSTRAGAPASIAATGFGLACYVTAVERGYLKKTEAVRRINKTLRFLLHSPHGDSPDATGYHGFYYHFLDLTTGRRAGGCELSTIDTTLLLAGMLNARAYFTGDSAYERALRDQSEEIFRRVDWHWAQNGADTVTHGWMPESGFLNSRWQGYNEGLLLYILALGSPTFPLPEKSYAAWTQTYRWKKIYGHEFLYAGPLFIHEMPHSWIDFREIQDDYMREKGIDYFENSRRAVLVQQEYARRNPRGFAGYNAHCWGVTAADGPGPIRRKASGKSRHFYDYIARGVPHGPDDGTLSPWAAAAAIPFAPEIVLPTIQYLQDTYPRMNNDYGFKNSFNPTFLDKNNECWVSPVHQGIDLGPLLLMIENYHTSFPWRVMRACPFIETGLRRAGFTGGWLEKS